MTETLESFECVSCEETVTEGDTYYDDARWANLGDGGQICWPCFEMDAEPSYSAVVTVLDPGDEPWQFLLGTHVCFELEYGEDIDPAVEVPGLTKGWVQTDGWRGYTTIMVPDDMGAYAGGSDLWGLTTGTRTAAEEISEAHRDGLLTRRALIVSAPTSNVFSRTLDVFVHEDDLDDEGGLKAIETDEGGE